MSRDEPALLFLLSTLETGGSERKTVRLANDFASRRQGVTLAYLGGAESLRSTIHPAVRTVNLQRRGKFSLRALLALLRLIRAAAIAQVFAVNLYAALYAVLAKWFLRSRRLRVVVSINTTEFGSRKEARQMLLYRWMLRGADALVFGSQAQRDLWCARYALDRGEDRAIVLYNGVDPRHFNLQAAPGVGRDEMPRGGLIVGTVGMLRPEKAHTDLVKAVARLRAQGIDIGALIIGEGPERANIVAECARSGVEDHVRIVGEVRDVRAWLAALEIFVLTSTSVETFSNAALEAMAMERPVISSCVGGMSEMLAYGGGLLYPPGDVDALCRRLTRLLEDADLRRRTGQDARRIAIERFSWNAMVSQFSRRVLERHE